ncbi:MAG: poly(3-hydroxyalkanoate) depolymerase [Frankiales bacterium]|nr:poly(3-hydroxyalkanoate) depolymerase [Frankiales bacterium]
MNAPERSVRVRALGVDVHGVVREGTGGGVPLLLCNGIGAHHSTWRPFVEALDARLTTIRFDAPGVGASSTSRLPLPYQAIAEIAVRLVRELDRTGQFDLLGISWGGALAQQIAFQHPRACRRLVLAATGTGSLMVPGSPRVLRHMVAPGRYRDPEYARRVAGTLYGGAVRRDPAAAAGLLTGEDRPPSRRGYLHQLLAGAGWTSLPWLPLIRQRTLVLAGTDDPIVPVVNARVMTRLLPHARLHTYDDGHLALITSATTLAPVVSQFLLEA